jgi:hypothetical protein
MTSTTLDWDKIIIPIKSGPGSWQTIVSTFQHAASGMIYENKQDSRTLIQLDNSPIIGTNDNNEPTVITELNVIITRVGKLTTILYSKPNNHVRRDSLVIEGIIINNHFIYLPSDMPRFFCATYDFKKNKPKGALRFKRTDWRDEFTTL